MMFWIRNFPWLLCLLLFACSSFQKGAKPDSISSENTENTLAEVRTGRHIRKFAGNKVTAIGRYRILLDYSDSPPRPTERAELLLRDGFGIAIGRGPEGLRPARERKKLAGKQVRIRASLQPLCRLSRQGYFASYEAACFTNIESLQAIPAIAP